MTDPLEGITDAHLQAAGAPDYAMTRIRKYPGQYPATTAHARQIAANEKLAAELAELRAKYEPEIVDPVEAEIEALIEEWRRGPMAHVVIRKAFLRGMEMQPAPFTRDEAGRIVYRFAHGTRPWADILTTPRADLLAMLGDG